MNESPAITVFDVGAFGGAAKHWARIGGAIEFYGFEPLADECERLNAQPSRLLREQKFFPVAIAGETGNFPFFVTKRPTCASLVEPDIEVFQRYGEPGSERAHRGDIKEVINVDCLSFRDLCSKENVIPDFIKLDTQGSEYELLHGFDAWDKLIAMEIEVEFIPLYRDQKLFAEVEQFVRAKGFQIVGLKRNMMKRNDGKTCTSSAGGQLIHADALFFHSRFLDGGQDKGEATKAALIAYCYGMHDISKAIIAANGLDGAALLRTVKSVQRREPFLSRARDWLTGIVRPNSDIGRIVKFDEEYGF